MARSQEANGYVPCFDQHWAKGQVVRDEDPSGNAAISQLALSDNTNWAQRSPVFIAQGCNDGSYRYASLTGTVTVHQTQQSSAQSGWNLVCLSVNP